MAHETDPSPIDRLTRLVEQQRDELRAQSRRVSELEARVAAAEPSAAPKRESQTGRTTTGSPLSRTRLLQVAGTGVAAMAAASLFNRGASAQAASEQDAGQFVATGDTNQTAFVTNDYAYSSGAYFTGYLYGVQAYAYDGTGHLNNGIGVYAKSGSSSGVLGESNTGIGVEGNGYGSAPGVSGFSSTGCGMEGTSGAGVGVLGAAPGGMTSPVTTAGVYGDGHADLGVYGHSAEIDGIRGVSDTSPYSGLAGFSTATDGGYGTYGQGVTGVFGRATGAGVGVLGVLNESVPPAAPANGAGVQGEGGSNGTGIYGHSNGLPGVTGLHSTGSIPENGCGVYGAANTAAGVVGESNSGNGIEGVSNASHGYGVTGFGYTGVLGTAQSVGIGVIGLTSGTAIPSGTYGVFGAGGTSGVGVRGTSSSSHGVEAQSTSGRALSCHGGTDGLSAVGADGRGGLFQGTLAQINLVPATTSGPPTSSSPYKGDLFLDTVGHLYLCTNGGHSPTWVRVQTVAV